MKTDEYRQRHILGSSFKSDEAGELLSDKFDLMVLVSSWDTRCISIVEGDDLHAKYGVTMYFNARDNKGLRDKHDLLLENFCKASCSAFNKVCGSSTDVHGMWDKLLKLIIIARRECGRPIRVFVDISSCPKYFAMAILGYCLRTGIAEKVTMFYAEGIYEEKVEASEVAFTGGHWSTVAVPSLEGTYDPEKKRFYLISVGFEGFKTLRVVSKADPNRVSVLFPNPGVLKEYAQRTREDNRELCIGIPEEQIIEAHAADVIGCWRSLEEHSSESPDTENTYYLCCGTKPHAIAMALRAIALEYPAVLYNIPEKHSVVHIRPAGEFWRYDLQDITSVS
jgi:hypothetical protein